MTATQSPSASSPPLFQSASQWLASLHSRRIGAVELLDLHLAQLERHNPGVNAVVAKDLDSARAAAKAADNTAPSAAGVLHGLPMTIKDAFEVAGMPTTCGFPFLADHRPQKDADAVARLKSAGAIVYGKTNLPPGAFDWQSANPVYGQTNNPWNLARSPGGSSGGSAAALAAGFTPLELGSDIGGSIRVPAHFCGIYGHKPTHGIVPGAGHIPPLPGFHLNAEMGVCGPLARSAHDLELAMDVLVAPGRRESPASRIAMPPSRHERLQDFRVALWIDDLPYAVDASCLTAIESWADDLRSIGLNIDRGARPDIDWNAAYDTYITTLMQLLGAGAPPELVQQMIDAGSVSEPTSYLARRARALKMRHCEYLSVVDQRERLYHRWQEFFGRCDVLICPIFPVVAYPHDHRGAEAPDPLIAYEARRMMVNDQARPYFDGLQWPAVATVADLPATAVPTGRRVDGMPMGVQLFGPAFEDRTSLRLAQLIEDALGSFTVPPGFA
ncbi:MAG TPA: amidase [Burkholderiaceae bacterium]|nr:amidase [Burkholderiaceae bacterium]